MTFIVGLLYHGTSWELGTCILLKEKIISIVTYVIRQPAQL